LDRIQLCVTTTLIHIRACETETVCVQMTSPVRMRRTDCHDYVIVTSSIPQRADMWRLAALNTPTTLSTHQVTVIVIMIIVITPSLSLPLFISISNSVGEICCTEVCAEMI